MDKFKTFFDSILTQKAKLRYISPIAVWDYLCHLQTAREGEGACLNRYLCSVVWPADSLPVGVCWNCHGLATVPINTPFAVFSA